MRKFPHKTPKWVTHEVYYDWYKQDTVVLRVDRFTFKHLIAPKSYKFTVPLFLAWDNGITSYYRFLRKAIRYSAKQGWLKPTEGDRICWESIKAWRRAARE